MTYGQLIRVIREAKQLSREQLALKVGVTPQMVRLWELGINDPRPRNRAALADALDSPGLAEKSPAAIPA